MKVTAERPTEPGKPKLPFGGSDQHQTGIGSIKILSARERNHNG